MEHQKISNLLNDANDSKFVTRKWNIVNDNSKANYNAGNETYNIIVVRGDITVRAAPETHKYHLKIVHHLLNVSQKLMEQQ